MPAVRVCLLFGSLLNVAVSADSPLPTEGTWIRYHAVHKPESGPDATYKATVKFLGRKDHNGVVCRWVEIVEQYEGEKTSANQFLIPERALRDSEHPLDDVVLARRKSGDGEAQRTERLSLFDRGWNESYLLFLPSLRKKAQPVEERQTVDHQHGRLLIPRGEQGEYRANYQAITVQETRSWVYDYKVWIDPQVAAGFARGHLQGRYERDGVPERRWTTDLYLEDFGDDAKSVFLE